MFIGQERCGPEAAAFRMALKRLPVQYRVYWALKALGLPREFFGEENMKGRAFIRELSALSVRDERLYNFVCESVPSDVLEDIRSEISAPTRAKQSERSKLAERDIKGKEWGIYGSGRRSFQRRRRAHDLVRKAFLREKRLHRQERKRLDEEKCLRGGVAMEE